MPIPVERITVPEPDRSAILDVVSAYTVMYDEDQAADMATLFTEDVVVNMAIGGQSPPPIHGLQPAVAMYVEARKAVSAAGKQCRHFSTNPLFLQRDADAARVRVNMLYTEKGTELAPALAGSYTFALRRDGGRWRLAEVSMNYD